MSLNKNELQELFRKDRSSADYFKEKREKEFEINSWDR